MSDSPSKPTSWLDITLWVAVGSLLCLGAAMLAEYVDQLTLQQWLFRLDFRHWFPGFVYPLWLMVALLAIDAITFRQSHANAAEAGTRKMRFEAMIVSIKACLALLVVYLVLNMCFPLRGLWFWWYLANIFLLAVFTAQWSFIHKTKVRTDLTHEALGVRKCFLAMSYTITAELVLYSFLHMTGLLHSLYNSLIDWFGYGAFTLSAVFAFFLICAALCITLFVIKEWLAAIRQHCNASRKTLLKQSE